MPTSIRDFADLSCNFACDDALLSLDSSDLQTRVLRLLEHFVSVQSVKRLGSVLACDFRIKKNRGTSWMEAYETRDVVYFGVNDDPLWSTRSRSVKNLIMVHGVADNIAFFVVLPPLRNSKYE